MQGGQLEEDRPSESNRYLALCSCDVYRTVYIMLLSCIIYHFSRFYCNAFLSVRHYQILIVCMLCAVVMAIVDNNLKWREVNGTRRRSETHNNLSWIVTVNATFFCLVSLSSCVGPVLL